VVKPDGSTRPSPSKSAIAAIDPARPHEMARPACVAESTTNHWPRSIRSLSDLNVGL
jgi:hypothetical protein